MAVFTVRFSVFCVFILFFSAALAACPQDPQVPVSEMCIPSVQTGPKVFIDMSTATEETRDCRCTFTTTADTVKLMTHSAPNYANCGTVVDVTMGSGANMKLECLTSGTFFDTSDNKNGTITLEQTSPPFDNSYCLTLEQAGRAWDTVTMTCTKAMTAETAASASTAAAILEDPARNIVPVNDAINPMFSAPKLPSSTNVNVSSSFKPAMQKVTTPVFSAPDPLSNKTEILTSIDHSVAQSEMNPVFSAPKLPANNESTGVVFPTLKLPSSNVNLSPSLEMPVNSQNVSSLTSDVSGSSLLQNNIANEKITGAILFQGNLNNDSKHKQFQSINLVNSSNELSVEAIDKNSNATENVQPVINAIQDNNVVANITSVSAGTVTLGSIFLPTSKTYLNADNIPANASSNSGLSSNDTALDKLEIVADNRVNTNVNMHLMEPSLTDAVETNETNVDIESKPLVSVPLFKTQMSLNGDSKNLSIYESSKLAPETSVFDILKGILPVIADSANVTRTNQSVETPMTDNSVETNYASGKTETSSNGTLEFADLKILSRAANINTHVNSFSGMPLNNNDINTGVSSDVSHIPEISIPTSAAVARMSGDLKEKSSANNINVTQKNVITDGILDSFIKDGLLRLQDGSKRHSVDFVTQSNRNKDDNISVTGSDEVTSNQLKTSTRSPTSITTAVGTETTQKQSTDFETPADLLPIDRLTPDTSANRIHPESGIHAENNASVPATASVEIETIRTGEQQPQGSKSALSESVNPTLRTTETTTTMQESRFSSAPQTLAETREVSAYPSARSTYSSVESVTESQSTKLSLAPAELNLEKSAAVISTLRNITSTTENDAVTGSNLSAAPYAKTITSNIPVFDALPTVPAVEILESTANTSVSKAPVASLEVNLPVAEDIPLLSTLTTDSTFSQPGVFDPKLEPAAEVSDIMTMSRADKTAAENRSPPDATDLSFTIVRLLKLLTVKRALDSLSNPALSAVLLNDIAIETTTSSMAILENSIDQHGGVAEITNIVGKAFTSAAETVTESQIHVDKSQAAVETISENSANVTVTDNDIVNRNIVKTIKQQEIIENITEPSDIYARTFPTDIDETVTQKTPELVKTTKKAYSVVVETVPDKHLETSFKSNKVNKAATPGEDDPALFGIDRNVLIVILAIIGAAVLLLICLALVANRRRKKRTASAPITRNGFTIDNIVYDHAYSEDPEKGAPNPADIPQIDKEVSQTSSQNGTEEKL